MTNRFITLVVAVAAAFGAYSAIPVGSWSLYPSFTIPATRVVETSDKVFYLAGGGLFSRDKGTGENIAYTIDNALSDYYVTDIYLDKSNERIAIAYSNGNIDILSPDGSVVNISDIRDASVSSSKSINGISWRKNMLYVATDFGVVEIDINSRKVISSGNYGVKISAIGTTDDLMVISVDNDLLTASLDSKINKLDGWNKIYSPGPTTEIASVNGSTMLAKSEGRVTKLTFEGKSLISADEIGFTTLPFFSTDNGAGFVSGNTSVANGQIVELPVQVSGNVIGALDPALQIWALDNSGLVSFVRSGNTWSIVNERARPYSFSVREASFIIPDKKGDRVYFTILGPSAYRTAASTVNEGIFTRQQTSLLADGNISDVAARGVKLGVVAADYVSRAEERAAATTRLAEDPDDDNTYFIGTGNDGLYKVKESEFVGKYDKTNAPMSAPWGSRVYEVSFDKGGNMWIGADGLTPSTGIMVLPAVKRKLDPEQVNSSDWYVPDLKGFENGKDIRIFHCEKSPVIFIFSSNSSHCFVAYHTNGTPDNFTDDKVVLWNDLTDTDGKNFSPTRFTSITEDRHGKVWIGTSEGVIEIASPESALDPSLRVRRLKIDHGDGTGLSDYFAGTDMVLDICTDGANRKWVATEASGVYLLNPEGNEIISHFTASNSPLPEQKVNAVYASATDNSVYFATPQGIMVYGGSSVAPAESLSDIKVYPNPVTPEYGGDVTVEGLTDGALVKIADSAGTVLWQTRAEGGMITWNLTDSAGKRVRTGIYYIFASSAANSSSKGAVAKIAVVN
ncbi:MAG: hypothetical protein K2G09_07990 [Paramuribaculum sp.]|nr:hypothetical protein [Paramuribaculum sp.]